MKIAQISLPIPYDDKNCKQNLNTHHRIKYLPKNLGRGMNTSLPSGQCPFRHVFLFSLKDVVTKRQTKIQ